MYFYVFFVIAIILYYNLVIIGDGGCGKTSILSSFLFQTFSNEYEPTVFENLSHQYTYNGQPRVLKLV